jgi:asparagine synthase (glutamine-hydrolysing)
MCGINGILSLNEISNKENRIKNMNSAISHRGPDASGMYLNGNIALGHQRLSIIDLDRRSNQPFKDPTNRYQLVYNGEVFNYLSLKKELNYNFLTTSDTEVVLMSIILKGLDWFLERANGFFAFAFYDNIKEELILCRDRFGIKPLYFYSDKENLVFSSEIKGILSSGLVEPEFNDKAIDEYLANRYVRSPFTFFKNIMSLNSSTYIKVSKRLSFKETKYWELPEFNTRKHFNEKLIIEECKNKIFKGLKDWFISDVSVGSYLSGGVDSSLTTALLSEANSQVNTYTIGFEENGFNEFKYAKQIAELYNTNHNEILLSKDEYYNNWENLIYFKDSPLGIPNEIPLAVMTKNLSRDIKVVISGEGADELFGGYGRIFRLGYDNRELSKQAFKNSFLEKYEYLPREIRDKYLKIKNYRDYFNNENHEIFFKSKSKEESIFRYFHTNHIQGLLQRVDMTSMHTGVEARPPFLNHELVEYAYKEVPLDLKIKWKNSKSIQAVAKKGLTADQYSEEYDTPKYILKKIAEKYLPNNILHRKKMGFPVPLNSWFPELKERAEDILSNTNWIDNKTLNALFQDLNQIDRSGHTLWMFMNIEIFYKKYFNKTYKY